MCIVIIVARMVCGYKYEYIKVDEKQSTYTILSCLPIDDYHTRNNSDSVKEAGRPSLNQKIRVNSPSNEKN